MSKSLTIQISDDLEQQLVVRAAQLNISLETLIAQSLAQTVKETEPDDTPKEDVLTTFHRVLQEAQARGAYPIKNLTLNPYPSEQDDIEVYDPITPLIGTLNIGTTDLGENHDHYIGQALLEELHSND